MWFLLDVTGPRSNVIPLHVTELHGNIQDVVPLVCNWVKVKCFPLILYILLDKGQMFFLCVKFECGSSCMLQRDW